jgi:hypothetical protein
LIWRGQHSSIFEILAVAGGVDGRDFHASSDSHSYERSSRLIAPLLYWLFPQISANTVDWVHSLPANVRTLTEYSVFAWLLWRAFHRPVNRRGTSVELAGSGYGVGDCGALRGQRRISSNLRANPHARRA